MRRPSRFSRLILTCVFAAAAGASALAQLSAGPSLPSLSGFTPAQGAQGTIVNIIFTGKNFVGKGLGLQFSPAAGLKVGILQAISSTQISAQVQIDAGAQVGPHGVLLVVADRGLQSNMPFVVTGAPCGTPGTPPCQPQTALPALRGFSPLQGTQGSNVTVTFTGANFSGAASAQFTPGAGITVQSTTVVNGNQIQAQLAIDANAPLGVRAVSLLLGKTRLQAQNTFTIVAGEKPGQPAALQLLRVIPNQVPAGSENLDLTLIGTNFVPGTQVTFTRAGAATDVFVVGASRYVNSTELHVVVNVLPTALAGGRDINLQTPSRQTAIGKGMLNVLAPASSGSKQPGPPAIIKITPIALQKFSEGVIKLDAPEWGDHWEGEIEYHYGMPMLDDDVVFRWHEQNPGTADYYELRIYARDGKTLLTTKRIDGNTADFFGKKITLLPTYLRPDAAFLADLLGKTAKPSLKPFLYQAADFKAPVVNNGKLVSLKTGGPQVSDGDMQWEVAGFRTYNKSGATEKSGSIQQQQQLVQKQANSGESGQTDLEVEKSDRWPLGAPQAPTGLNCSGAGTGAGLQMTNVAVSDDSGKQKSGVDPNNYIGDLWVLSGNFNLSRSPYATHPNLHQAPCSHCLFGQVDQIQFDDVFLDWGDGTVQKVNAPPKDSGVTNWSRGDEMSLPPDAKNPFALKHVYQYPGSYAVRVFQLSEADAQHVDPSLVAASVDGPGIHPFLQAVVLANVAANASKTGGNLSQANFKGAFQSITLGKNSVSPSVANVSNAVLTPEGPSPGDVAGRAFMIYCHTVTVTTREDLDADGPLHLKEIKDPDFPGHDATKFKAISPSLRRSQVSPESMPQGVPPARLMLASASQQKEQPQLRPLRPQTPTADAICRTCDDAMMATSAIEYYGTGRVQITWHIDGTVAQKTLHLDPSDRRTNLQRAAPGVKEPPIILTWSKPIDSTALQVQPLGMHEVSVEAEVIPEPSFPNLSIAVQKTLVSIMGPSKEVSAQAGSAQVGSSDATAQAKSLLNMLAPPPGSGLSPLKVGLLSPMKQNGSGMGAVQYINAPLATVAAKANELPDQHVASKPKHYQVVEADPTQPCKFKFPVKSGGSFEIGGLQGHITKNGTKYSGTGNLIIHMANAQSDGYDLYPPIPVKIDNWDVPDGETVASGNIDVSPKLDLAASMPALTGTIDRIQGSAGGEVDATLSVTLSDDTLRLPGVEKPQTWSGVTSELHANGDWSKDNLTLPTTLIGWSAFQMQSSKVRLDLSHHDGDAASCGLNGADWVGVRFSSLTIIPYTMDLVAASALQPTVTDWGILDSGLCGSTLTTGPAGPFALGDGSVSLASITFTASNRSYKAHYKQMDIYVPWLDTHLKGDADLQSGGGKQASITFPFNGGSASKTYSNVAMKATNLQFTKQGNIGWVVQSSTHFTLNAENKPFAAFDVPIYYGMDGRAYFANGAGTLDVHLGGSSHLAQTPLDLNAAHLTAPMNGDKILGIQVDANVHLSEVMPAAEANIDYEIDKSNKTYSAGGPSYAPFTIDVPYPAGQPSSEAKVHPQYSGGQNSEYTGKVDVSEIGGPPLTGEFRLGYKGGHDYWLARVSFDLGDEGVPIIPAPPIMNLYTIRGGMGHNFPLSAFKDESSITNISPVFDDSFLFMAGLRVGMPDKFTYTLDGDLVIKATGQNAGTRMDFHSWLLKSDHSGNGDFQGFFQYAGSNFDGRLWGHLDFMNGMAYLDLGNSENNAAIDMHFGNSGPWHIDAGKKEGPRIHGHLLIADADAYFMLSNDGLALGGSESFNLTVGDDSVASAYVRGMVDVGVAITPQPHVAGDFGANVSAGVCVDSICVSDSLSAQVHAEFAPLDVRATASLPLPWPLSDITFTVHI